MRAPLGHHGVRIGLVLALTIGLSAGGAASAVAQCGQDYHGAPAHSATAGAPPLAIGDSVLADAVPLLVRAGFEADGMVCRQMSQGLTILRARASTLPRLVVLALGTNGEVTPEQIDTALSILGPKRMLVLVVPHGSVAPSSPTVIRDAAAHHPGRILLLDWDRLVAGHPGWLAPDGVHLGGSAGIAAFAQMIASVLPDAGSTTEDSEAAIEAETADEPEAANEPDTPTEPGTPITIQPPPGHRDPLVQSNRSGGVISLAAIGTYLASIDAASIYRW